MDRPRHEPPPLTRGVAVLLGVLLLVAMVAPSALGASVQLPGSSPAPPGPGSTPRPAFPDPFGVHASPPPPVGQPRIPGAGAIPTPTVTPPPRSFLVRHFPLPASIDWQQLFPAGRWKGPPEATGPVDADGLPMRRWRDKALYYTPTNLGIQALRRLEGYRVTGDPAYLASARRMADKLRELAIPDGDAIWLPFPYDDKRARMRAPWVNALGQAVALALFSRLHRLEGREDDLAFATGLFRSFTHLRRDDAPWVSEVDADGYLWFEHYPDGLRGRVLNAHAYAVLALRDYWQETGTREARRWLEGGLTTLRDNGPLFRREGTWSWYNLRNPAAHANYHLFHIRQLRALTPASGDPWFAQFAAALSADFTWAPWMQVPRRPSPAAAPLPGPEPPPSAPAAGPTPSPS